jgi:hypothetical protein
MFELFYKAGKSLADSFFIGREGKDDVLVISASEVLPLEMQKKIEAAEEELNKVEVENTVEGTPATEDKAIENLNEAEVKLDSVKEDIQEAKGHEEMEKAEEVVEASKVDVDAIYKKAGVPTPEFIAKQIASVCKDFAGFKQFCKEAKANKAEMVKEASLKKEAAKEGETVFTFNTGEDKNKPAKATEGAIVSVNEKEAKADAGKGVKDANAVSSPVKSYFGRLPGNGGGDAVESINRQSSLKEQFLKLTAELDEMKKKDEEKTEKLGKMEDENKNLKEEISNGNKDKDINAIISEIKKVVKVQKENVFKDKLVKADEKALKVVLDVVKEIAKLSDGEKADKDVAGLFGGEAKKDNKKEEVVDFTEVKASRRMPGQNIPQVFSQYNGGDVSGLNSLFED